jgi:hypothetical protein
MTHTFSKSAFYSFGDIPLIGPLPLIFSHLLRDYRAFHLRILFEEDGMVDLL